MIFKVEYNDPEAGYITVAAGDFKDITSALTAAKRVYKLNMIRVKCGTQEDLDHYLSIAPKCQVCNGPLGFAGKRLICDSCGAEHTYESGEPYLEP